MQFHYQTYDTNTVQNMALMQHHPQTYDTSNEVQDSIAKDERMCEGMARIKGKGLVGFSRYRPERFFQHLAKCRYSRGNSVVATLPIKVFVRLALCLKSAEWAAIESSAACTAAVEAITEVATDLEGWVKIWQAIDKANYRWSAMFLLGM